MHIGYFIVEFGHRNVLTSINCWGLIRFEIFFSTQDSTSCFIKTPSSTDGSEIINDEEPASINLSTAE